MAFKATNPDDKFSSPMGLAALVVALVPESQNCLAAFPPPLAPDIQVGRKDLARVFGKNVQTPKRWERQGWINAARKKSGRIIGYDVVAIVSLAARLFSHFTQAKFSHEEAARLGLEPLLTWVLNVVRKGIHTGSDKPVPVLDLVGLAALAEAADILPASWDVTESQLREHQGDARRQMTLRLRNPVAQRILIQAWRESGVVVAAHSAQSSLATPQPRSHAA